MASGNRLRAAERRRQALKLRRAGCTYNEIASALGYRSASGTHKAVQKGLHDTLSEPAHELRKLEAARLDSLLAAVWDAAMAGHLGAVDRALRVAERRARLLGLDQPAEVDIWPLLRLGERADGIAEELMVSEAEAMLSELEALNVIAGLAEEHPEAASLRDLLRLPEALPPAVAGGSGH